MTDEKKKRKPRKKKSAKADPIISKPDDVLGTDVQAIEPKKDSADATPPCVDAAEEMAEKIKEIAEKTKADGVVCCMCGAYVERKKAIMVGNHHVCSKACMKRFATARPRF